MVFRNYKQAVITLGTGSLLLVALVLLLSGMAPTARAYMSELFVAPGGAGACLQDDPCSLEAALDMAGTGNTIYVGAGTYTGTGAAVITITKSIVLLGGWDGMPTGDPARDPIAYPTTLDGEDERRAVYIAGVAEEITPTLDGFIVTRGNATNAAGITRGGGIYVSDAAPSILHNTFVDNVALSGEGDGWGGAIYLSSNSEPAIIRGNTIASNTAGTSSSGQGGGVSMVFSSAVIEDNDFRSNIATSGNGFGGGIHMLRSSARVDGNLFDGNDAGTGYGGGFYAQISDVDFSHNAVLNNTAWAGAVTFESTEPVTATNNIIVANQGGGVFTRGNATYRTSATLAHNTVALNGSYAVYVGFNTSGYSEVTLTNNILVSHTTGIRIYDGPENQVTATHTLFYGNGVDIEGSGISSSNEITGADPVFADAAGMDYALSAGSPAIDAGIPLPWITDDIDGDPRPFGGGYDIGADEVSGANIYLPSLLSRHHP